MTPLPALPESLLDEASGPGDEPVLADRLVRVAGALRAALVPLVTALAGTPPRPVRLTRSDPGPGLDKSLASRLVAAAKAESDQAFLHLVPSPTGLRMLIASAGPFAARELLDPVAREVDAFQALLDAMPGGRQALDARLGESQAAIREKREHIARQGAYKSVSFLLGHTCDTLATALVVLPSATPGRVDVIEVHRRFGLQRLVPDAPLPLMGVFTAKPGDPAAANAPRLEPLGDARPARAQASPGSDGEPSPDEAARYFVPEGSQSPLPRLVVRQEGAMSTFLLADGEADLAPITLTTAHRVPAVETDSPDVPWLVMRTYLLHTPSRRLVRDVWIAEGLWPGMRPEVAWYLPGIAGAPRVLPDPDEPHHRRIPLTSRIEPRPVGPGGFALEGVPDHEAVLAGVLRRAGHDPAGFRGWRCDVTYPLPLVEMNITFRFEGGPDAA